MLLQPEKNQPEVLSQVKCKYFEDLELRNFDSRAHLEISKWTEYASTAKQVSANATQKL